MARHARFLTKRGVNLVQLQRKIGPATSAAFGDINAGERDGIWRTVAAMKREGIYTVISPYWAVPIKFSKDWGIAGSLGTRSLADSVSQHGRELQPPAVAL